MLSSRGGHDYTVFSGSFCLIEGAISAFKKIQWRINTSLRHSCYSHGNGTFKPVIIDVKNIITAEKNALITTPASSREVTCDFAVKCPMYQTSQTVIRAPPNAKTAIGEPPQKLHVTPDKIAMIAPNPAPLEMPRI